MFDIAWSEILLIAVVALIFIGPKELPYVLHSIGRMVTKIRRSADDLRRQFEDSVREAGYEDLHKNIQEFRSLNPANQLKDHIARALNQDAPPAAAATAAEPPLAEAPAAKAPAEAPASRNGLLETPAAKPAAEPAGEARPSGGPSPAGDFSHDRIAPAA